MALQHRFASWLSFASRLSLGLAVGLALVASAAAERLVLEDGSVVVGTLRGLSGGVYTIDSAALGVVQIPQARVARIEVAGAAQAPSAPPAQAAGSAVDAEVAGLQQQMLSDGRVVGRLLALSESPQLQAILGDPALMALIERGDLAALERDPKIQALMADPAFAEIQEALGQ